ncbi:MAG: DNA-directed RNA polymerase subunit omega [Bacillota bacterium]
MNQPALDELMNKVDSKYTLVVVAAKRARVLTEKGNYAAEKSTKAVTVALNEISQRKVSFERTKTGIK